jgi:hypothetical protein
MGAGRGYIRATSCKSLMRLSPATCREATVHQQKQTAGSGAQPWAVILQMVGKRKGMVGGEVSQAKSRGGDWGL